MIWPIFLLAIAGILVGGVIQLIKSKATKFSIGVVAVLAAVALAGGIAWMIPGGSS